MPDSSTVCPACGARLADDASACDLCGHDLALPTDDELLDESVDIDPPGLRDIAYQPAAPRAVFCNACGHANPSGAKFCSQCGTALQRSSAAALEAPRPERVKPAGLDVPTGTRLWAMVGGAALLVAGLFALRAVRHDAPVTSASGGAGPVATAPASGGAANPSAPPEGQSLAPTGELTTLTPAQTQQLDSLRRVADGLSGTAQTDKRRELARLQYAFGRPDEAGQTMEAVAAASNDVKDWRSAGDFLYQWMETLPEDQRGPSAARTIAAYEAVLAKEDSDLDSRTRLGWASQYAGDNPMRAVLETQAVLQADSNHVGANYNRAFLLLKIGRTDQALAQLRKVQRLAGAESALGRQAAELTQAIEQQQGAASQ